MVHSSYSPWRIKCSKVISSSHLRRKPFVHSFIFLLLLTVDMIHEILSTVCAVELSIHLSPFLRTKNLFSASRINRHHVLFWAVRRTTAKSEEGATTDRRSSPRPPLAAPRPPTCIASGPWTKRGRIDRRHWLQAARAGAFGHWKVRVRVEYPSVVDSRRDSKPCGGLCMSLEGISASR